jgi:hypothetical protein
LVGSLARPQLLGADDGHDDVSRNMKKMLLWPLALAILSPLLLGCNVPLGSYPRFWDYSKTRPKDADLVGTYKLLTLRLAIDLDRSVRGKDPTLILKADHSAVLTDVPEFDSSGQKLVCRLSGTSNWDLDDEINSGWGWSVAFQNYHSATTPPTRECSYENRLWGILVLSRHATYRLYAIVGDPDSDTGIEFKKVGR